MEPPQNPRACAETNPAEPSEAPTNESVVEVESVGNSLSLVTSFPASKEGAPRAAAPDLATKTGRQDYAPKHSGRGFVYPTAFSALWSVYPMNNGAKLPAYRSWRTVFIAEGVDTHREIFTAAREFATVRANEESRFTPHLATWLNHRRWEQATEPDADGVATITATDDLLRAAE